ncbi:lytic transglycosylase domain-containing protein [Salinarimonas sp.]|uniref:lytic transglycosylase domain-containing protein n=1 Tax=Salinarimonas sp. TaxID=2766526 RepID=UPI00391A173E
MRMRPWALWILLLLVAASLAPSPARAQAEETLDEAVCRMIEGAARANDLPIGFLTRLIWQESSFRPHVVSHAGAQGIAQFMPGTAAERGLADPFDPEQAIPKAAELLSDLKARFGNKGLAAAAYNGGPRRVSDWLAARGGLPLETRDFVMRITSRSAEDWAALAGGAVELPAQSAEDEEAAAAAEEDERCLTLVALLRGPGLPGAPGPALSPFAPWGVQLAGNFVRERALATFERARRQVASVVGDAQPMVIGTRMRTRGGAPFYRVRLPAQTRAEAEALCRRIRDAGGACVVVRS